MHYPEQFDTTGPSSLEDSYAHLSWAVVSVRRVLDEQGDIGWELLPDRLGQAWGDPQWYERPWLADFYHAIYHHAGGLEPGQVFLLDEIGEPVSDVARVIDSVVQGWSSAAYQASVQDHPDHDGYPDPGQVTGYEQDAGQVTGYEQDAGQVTGYEQYPDQVTGYQPGTDYEPEPETEPETEPEAEAELDPAVAREVLARVVDDEEDDLSAADQRILATVLSVERYQYLAREYDLV